MSFKRTITTSLTKAEAERSLEGFASVYSLARDDQALRGNLVKPQPQLTMEASPPTDRAVVDALFGFSSGSGYSAINEGLAYLQEVHLANRGIRSSAVSRFGGSDVSDTTTESGTAGSNAISKMSTADGVAFVKVALGLGVVDQIAAPALQAQSTQYATNVFASLQSGTFSPNLYAQAGRALAQSTYSYATATTFPSSNRAAIGDAANTSFLQRMSMMFDFSRTNLQQSSYYNTGGMAQGRLSRAPEVKLKFLFYCELEFWYEAANTLGVETSKIILGGIYQCSSPSVTFNADQVNFYGLNSRVNKSTTYNNVTVQLYDDLSNQSASLFTTIMAASTGSFGAEAERSQDELQDIAGQPSASSRSSSQPATNALANRNGILKSVRTTQVYVRDGRCFKDVTTFLNPKIASMMRSDLDMTDGSQPAGVTIEFAYDALNVETGLSESSSWRDEVDSGNLNPIGTGGDLISGPDTPPAPSGPSIPGISIPGLSSTGFV